MKRLLTLLLACLVLLCPLSAPAEGDAAAYEAERQRWIASPAAAETLSAEEQAVDALLAEMKEEADRCYDGSTAFGLIAGPESPAAKSRLFDFCRALPKGGELHTHDSTFLSADGLIDLLISWPGVRICLDGGDGDMCLYGPKAAEIPESAVGLKEALDSGRITRKELRDALTLPQGLNFQQAWKMFDSFFAKTSGLDADLELRAKLFEEAFRSAVRQNVLLLETKIWMTGREEYDRQVLEMIRQCYYTVKREFPAFTVRVIACSGKQEGVGVEKSTERLRGAIRLSREVLDESDPEHPQPFVIGLDLVQEEDTGLPLKNWAGFFLSEEVRSSGLELYLHCGESLQPGNESVVDAVLLSTRRLGHGLNLFRFPRVVEKVLEDGIAVEVCPVSNCLLGYCPDLRLHPAQHYLQRGIPVVLCSDDAMYLEHESLTEDWFAAVLSWDLSLAEIRQIARNAILYSGLPAEKQEELLDAWQKQWDDFIKEEAKTNG